MVLASIVKLIVVQSFFVGIPIFIYLYFQFLFSVWYLVFFWIFGDELQEHTIVLLSARREYNGWVLMEMFHISKRNRLCAMWKRDTCLLLPDKDWPGADLPQAGLLCVGSWLHSGKISENESRWFWEYFY